MGKKRGLFIALHPVYERKNGAFPLHRPNTSKQRHNTLSYNKGQREKHQCKAHNYKVLAKHNTTHRIMVSIYLHHVVTQLHHLIN